MTTTVSRAEHLAWCKRRAIAYCDDGDINNAITSMGSDMSKHPETEHHAALGLMIMMHVNGHFRTAQDARKFIEGFN